ncbi:hypothetical protein CPB85DRAFT_1429083 [Mucidula mucida]|nr:hypothetical protein CPB85DRAFT_1429083 [Mucidula mucida]
MRVALITGAAQGIGQAIAQRLEKDGFSIAVNDLPSKQVELQSGFPSALVVVGDVSSEKDVQGMIAMVVEELGGLDVFVANAGVGLAKSILSTTTDDWDRMARINGRGTFLCYKYAAEQMIKQGRGGRIIGASSIAGKQGMPFLAAYSSSKWMIRGLTQVAAKEFGSHGITVNAYAPGATESELMTDLAKAFGHDDLKAYAAENNPQNPLGRLGQPEDVANLVSYLASDQASYITGQSISVNGGSFCD